MHEYRGYHYELYVGESYLNCDIYLTATRRFPKKFWRKKSKAEETYLQKQAHVYIGKKQLGGTPEQQIVEIHQKAQEKIDKIIKEIEDEQRLKDLCDEPRMEFMGRVMK